MPGTDHYQPEPPSPWARRNFLKACGLAAGSMALAPWDASALETAAPAGAPTTVLPVGRAQAALSVPHFPDRLHAFVWRNWQLVPAERLASVVGATASQILRLGRSMGLQGPPRITANQQHRSYITVIRRNWHLLPYDQLLQLLGWTAEQLAFTLREDDFLFVKLGNQKPQCEPLRYVEPNAETQSRATAIANLLREELPNGAGQTTEPLFAFVDELSRAPRGSAPKRPPATLTPRYCYSYFALYGDPLLEPLADPYPDGFLARLAEVGVDGVWLQALLSRLAPFPWDPPQAHRHEERLKRLAELVKRARRHGMGVYLYLNEPRSQPLAFYRTRPHLRGVTEGEHAAVCTEVPEVREYLKGAVAHIVRAVPDLAGFFTISGSENLTHCWSHGQGQACPRCARRAPADVVAGLLRALQDGIREGGGRQRLFAWDWGWADGWVPDIVKKLPKEVALMSVSEWSLPIRRGGIATEIGEYSMSAVGPGPRATKHWSLAKKEGLRTMAKMQCGNTWELSAVPYIPVVANVAYHAANLRSAGVDGLMLGWTLGGYPSPNLEVVTELACDTKLSPEQAMLRVAQRRFGRVAAPAVVQAWESWSAAFREYPFGGGLYSAPLQMGPANLLHATPTRYTATMVGLPYDDLEAWRGPYPGETFANQLAKVADGFDAAIRRLQKSPSVTTASRSERNAVAVECRLAEASSLHFRSAAEQCRFILARRTFLEAKPGQDTRAARQEMVRALRVELDLAKRLHALQLADSRLGFEATNHYYYVPVDLAEKIVNCRHLLQTLAG